MYTSKIVSSLVKVFPDTEPLTSPETTLFTALKNETISIQLAYYSTDRTLGWIFPKIESPIKEYMEIRSVELAPAAFPIHHTGYDDNYLRTKPGLFPDILRDSENNAFLATTNQWRAFWIDINIPKSASAGTFSISLSIINEKDEVLTTAKTEITIYNAVLPKQELIHTEWFHADCLADYYITDVFSERHWELIEAFLGSAARRGCNMILTPIFTPPLDTFEGGERTTVQLIDITVVNNEYSFNFDKFEKWVQICQKCGMEHFEISHLFTQWGAKSAPKIMATVDKEYKQIFGWSTPAVGGEYTRFLHTFLPKLIEKVRELKISEKIWFHISDEPHDGDEETYSAAKESIIDYLDGFEVIDALSNYKYYESGLVKRPIPANNCIDPFIENNVPRLWTYYCTSQYDKVSNRFFAMPSQRNRIYGVQLYKYAIEGILHWGYNFYNSGHSLLPINPYQTTDSYGAFPAGDPFLVYPKDNGTPEESIRQMVLYHGISDQRALCYLESLTDKKFVMDLVEGDLASPITFSSYPTSDTYTLQLRNKVNQEIAKHV